MWLYPLRKIFMTLSVLSEGSFCVMFSSSRSPPPCSLSAEWLSYWQQWPMPTRNGQEQLFGCSASPAYDCLFSHTGAFVQQLLVAFHSPQSQQAHCWWYWITAVSPSRFLLTLLWLLQLQKLKKKKCNFVPFRTSQTLCWHLEIAGCVCLTVLSLILHLQWYETQKSIDYWQGFLRQKSFYWSQTASPEIKSASTNIRRNYYTFLKNTLSFKGNKQWCYITLRNVEEQTKRSVFYPTAHPNCRAEYLLKIRYWCDTISIWHNIKAILPDTLFEVYTCFLFFSHLRKAAS